MTSRVEELHDILQPEAKATRITERWVQYDTLRATWKRDKEEVKRYIYATSTSDTTNSTLPWKNKTTVPKTCQIMDNLFANYLATLFPRRKSIRWEANDKDSSSVRKRDAIQNYTNWMMEHPIFKHEMEKGLLDFIQTGNCFMTVEWLDERAEKSDVTQYGYVGPIPRRINPNDIVMNPTAESFTRSPKIVRSLISRGELKELLQRMTTDENREEYEALWDYLKEIRNRAQAFQGDWLERDNLYAVDGFTSYRAYLMSDVVEVLTFYGDLYDEYNDEFYKNHVITVVDRHKLINSKPNPSFFGYPPIFHCVWRKKPDNLWGMGPLDNLIGMQFRMDHVENLKADVFDLVTFPVKKIKGFVEDFVWQPGENIYVSEEGDVDMVVPDVNALQANFEIQNLERLMEEMAGAPREAMGFRTPGEKTAYEVQRLENASSRLYENKIRQFEEQMLEPLLNAMIELARRNMVGPTTVKVFDDEFNMVSFQDLTVEDITGVGRIRPVAARHFAEQAELIQNLTSLTGSNLWPVIQPHYSGIKLAKLVEEALNLKDFELVTPYVALAEQADAQKHINALQQQIAMEAGTATGIGEDFDLEAAQAPAQLPTAEEGPPQL